jgi:hypothetical protein
MKSFAWITLLAAAVVAQDSSDSSSPSSTASGAAPSSTSGASSHPLIPNSLSAKCKTYLAAFNTNTRLQACIAPIVSATSKFTPSSNDLTQADVSAALAGICAPAAACKQSDIQSVITEFYSNCQDDLVSGSGSAASDSLRTTFDIVYVLNPLRAAICTKDPKDDTYCLTKAKQVAQTSNNAKIAASADGEALDQLSAIQLAANSVPLDRYAEYDHGIPPSIPVAPPASDVGKRQVNDQVPMQQINPETWRKTNLHYMFLAADAPQEELCSDCTTAILKAYADFESAVPYPLGIAQSIILGGQKALWRSVTAKCQPGFMDGVISNAQAAQQSSAMTTRAASGASILGALIVSAFLL